MFGIVIDKNGYKVEFGEINEKGLINGYSLKQGERVITTDWNYANTLIKPQWNGNQWIERSNEIIENEVFISEQEKINSTLLKEITELKKEIALLKGGIKNVI